MHSIMDVRVKLTPVLSQTGGRRGLWHRRHSNFYPSRTIIITCYLLLYYIKEAKLSRVSPFNKRYVFNVCHCAASKYLPFRGGRGGGYGNLIFRGHLLLPHSCVCGRGTPTVFDEKKKNWKKTTNKPKKKKKKPKPNPIMVLLSVTIASNKPDLHWTSQTGPWPFKNKKTNFNRSDKL